MAPSVSFIAKLKIILFSTCNWQPQLCKPFELGQECLGWGLKNHVSCYPEFQVYIAILTCNNWQTTNLS